MNLASTSQLPSPVQERPDDRDLALLRRVAEHDRAAFEELYCDYHRRLVRFLSRVTPRFELVEEVINDTLWVVWRKASEFRGNSKVSTWILGIAYRCTLKSLRQAAGGGPLEYVQLDDEYLAADESVARNEELRDWIGKGLHQLPIEQRITMELAYLMGNSIEEIATIMDCPIGTVKARMFHARVKLRNLLPLLGGTDDRGIHESI